MGEIFCDFEKLNIALNENSNKLERAMEEFFESKSDQGSLKIIKDAQKYSLLGGGKRIRPFLVNEICRILGGKEESSMPMAMAVEMIHTYSLIHDDLPCMDDDDMRRGKPSNHKVFGEATAVLAGDALLTNAFSAVAADRFVSCEALANAVALMADAAGDAGMIGGQIIDIEGENKKFGFEELLRLHSLKTGRMIELSAALGCVCAGYNSDSEIFKKMCSYAIKIGLVFQIVDDVLDAIGDEQIVGKTLSSDAQNQKVTFLTFFSVEEAKKHAKEVTYQAIDEIADIEGIDNLISLALFLLDRTK